MEPFYNMAISHLLRPEDTTLISTNSSGFDLSEKEVWTILLCTVHTGSYVVICGGIEMLVWLGPFKKYRFRRSPRQEPSFKLILKTLLTAAVGQLITTPVGLWYGGFDLFKYFGMPDMDSTLPGFHVLFWEYFRCSLFNDWGFYWVHRLVHSKSLYALIHKQHHSYSGTISISAEFAGIPETLFANLLPTIGGALFFGSHPLVLMVWLFVRLEQTYESHSGVCFLGSFLHKLGLTNSNKTADHDFHHTCNRGNFGAYYMDYMFGTMDVYISEGGAPGYCKKNFREPKLA
jgi:sterol desaturase/sphingolipid hydroxylase (fatty acid hydroxylase superfamily)